MNAPNATSPQLCVVETPLVSSKPEGSLLLAKCSIGFSVPSNRYGQGPTCTSSTMFNPIFLPGTDTLNQSVLLNISCLLDFRLVFQFPMTIGKTPTARENLYVYIYICIL